MDDKELREKIVELEHEQCTVKLRKLTDEEIGKALWLCDGRKMSIARLTAQAQLDLIPQINPNRTFEEM